MYLVDTSVWIDYFRDQDNFAVQFFSEILDKKIPYSLSGVIYQEILQGASTKNDFSRLEKYLSTQRFVHPKDLLTTYQDAAYIYYLCRNKGITIRSTIDCLIAQLALENDLILLHNDKDFECIKKIMPNLKIMPSH